MIKASTTHSIDRQSNHIIFLDSKRNPKFAFALTILLYCCTTVSNKCVVTWDLNVISNLTDIFLPKIHNQPLNEIIIQFEYEHNQQKENTTFYL